MTDARRVSSSCTLAGCTGCSICGTKDARREPVCCTCKANGEHCYLCLYGEDAAAELRALADRLAEVERERDDLNVAVLSGIRHRQEYVERIGALTTQLTAAQATIANLRAERVKETSECVSLTSRLTKAEQQGARMRAFVEWAAGADAGVWAFQIREKAQQALRETGATKNTDESVEKFE